MLPKAFATALTPLVLTILLAACGSSDDGSEATAGQAEAGAFPVTIDHKHGSTTIESAPRRVVVVGLREQDALLALGVVPVATTEWYGKHPGAIFPWAKDELGDAEVPAVLSQTDGVEIEKVAAQRPDLILAIYSGLTKKEYDTLSKIAPVVAQPKGEVDYGSSWQEETLITGKAVGKPGQARRLVQNTERLIADAAAEHPEFNGQAAAQVDDYQGPSCTDRRTSARACWRSSGSPIPQSCARRSRTSSAASSRTRRSTPSTWGCWSGSPKASAR